MRKPPQEARAMLTDIYGWFTEGFDISPTCLAASGW
jgi:hypothetical protein